MGDAMIWLLVANMLVVAIAAYRGYVRPVLAPVRLPARPPRVEPRRWR